VGLILFQREDSLLTFLLDALSVNPSIRTSARPSIRGGPHFVNNVGNPVIRLRYAFAKKNAAKKV